MRRITAFAIAGAVAVAAAAAAMVYLLPGPLPQQTGAPAPDATTQVINQGEYLARAGDCVACHTVRNGKRFGGGRAMPTAFGNVYGAKSTRDVESGSGPWSAEVL